MFIFWSLYLVDSLFKLCTWWINQLITYRGNYGLLLNIYLYMLYICYIYNILYIIYYIYIIYICILYIFNLLIIVHHNLKYNRYLWIIYITIPYFILFIQIRRGTCRVLQQHYMVLLRFIRLGVWAWPLTLVCNYKSCEYVLYVDN